MIDKIYNAFSDDNIYLIGYSTGIWHGQNSIVGPASAINGKAEPKSRRLSSLTALKTSNSTF